MSGIRKVSAFAGFRNRFALSSWPALALVLAGGAILHVPALKAPFFADDFVFLDHVRFRSFTGTLFSQDPLGNFFRPVGRQIYFWLNAHIGNESPILFHSVNLCLFLISIALLYFIAKRLAGQMAGVVAAGLLALHYACDVPIVWASGSQDLLALTGALAALHLFLIRRPVLAAVVFFLALLCKETIAVTPLIAIMLARSETRSWKKAFRRATPLFLALIPWGILWFSFGSRQVAPGLKLTFSASAFAAALVQLARVTLGLEWPTGEFGSRWAALPPFWALLPIIIALLWIQSPSRKPEGSPVTGLGWALLGALPVATVASIWSAYYYVFALAGVALALGILAARTPRWVAILLLACIAWTSQGARHMNEFASGRGAWSAQSHLNSWYVHRGAEIVKSYLGDLKEARPTVPSGSTFFFFGIPGYTVWHSGPLVRWAYRDSSLHGYYIGEFSMERARPGPLFFFHGTEDRLVENPRGDDALVDVAAILLLQDNLNGARDALLLKLESKPTDRIACYWLGWLEWERGDTASALQLFGRARITPRRGPTPETTLARDLVQAGEFDRALDLMREAAGRHELDPQAHGLLSDLFIARGQYHPVAFISAFAARALDPQNPAAWRRWGTLQYNTGLHSRARVSFQRYFALGGIGAAEDEYVRKVMEGIPDLLPGGDQAQKDLRDPLKTEQ